MISGRESIRAAFEKLAPYEKNISGRLEISATCPEDANE